MSKEKLSKSKIKNLADKLETHYKQVGYLPNLVNKKQAEEWRLALKVLKERKKHTDSPAEREFYYSIIESIKTALKSLPEEAM